MSSSTAYHFGKASYILNLINGLKLKGIAVNRIIKKSNLRFFKYNNREAMLPIPVIYEFIELVQQELGVNNLSASFYKDYGLVNIGSYGLFLSSSKKVLPTIVSSLKYSKINLSNSIVSFKILKNGHAYYGVDYETAPCKAQSFMIDIDLSMQLELVLNANDKGWSPKEIHLKGSDTSIIEAILPHCKAKIVTNQPNFGLVIDLNTLSRPLLSSSNNMSEIKNSFKLLPESLSCKIEVLLDNLFSKYLPSIFEISRMFNISVSTLKRDLANEGTNFSSLIERWRFMKAIELLSSSEYKVKEISELLFYNNPSNFTRAFKNWTGLNPNVFKDNK